MNDDTPGLHHRGDDEQRRREQGSTDAPAEDKLVEEARNTARAGADRLNRSWRAMVVTGLFGGIDIGLGIMAMVLVREATGSPILAGLAFGVGLIALKMAHSELFTEEFLLPVNAIVAGEGTVVQLLRLWSVTLVTNLFGGWLFTWLLVVAFPAYHDAFTSAAEGYLVDRPWPEAIALAVAASAVLPVAATYVVLGVGVALLAESFGRDVVWLWRRRDGVNRTDAHDVGKGKTLQRNR